MKLIKKIAAIMFAFMMVVSMSCNVKADDTTATTETGEGKITINNAIPKQTYKLYRLLDLESYSVNEDGKKENGNYSYKPASKWKTFLEGDGIKDVYFTFENGYASWKKDANVETFAKLAIEHANKENPVIEADYQQPAPTATGGQTTSTVTFDSLPLGYYLVDSSAGSLCGLDTTAKEVTIEEKNGVPSVDKKVINTQNGTYGTSNNASIGDTVYFQTIITAQPGAQNYVLHDKMTDGLTFNNKVEVKKGESPVATSYYTLKTSDFNDDCTFEIVFGQTFFDDLQKDEKITVTYSATLNESAVIAGEGNKNETWLKYGENNNLETTHPTTDTKTFEMHVFKFYIDKNDLTTEKGLADAKFTLSKNPNGTDPIKLINKGSNTYRVAKKDETNTITEVITPDNGRFTIQGLGAGTYYLTEIQQPAGYNKLSGPVTVVIDENEKVRVGESEANPVKVENKSGTVLPSTGGAGTTMIYLIGGALVLGSGVVLVTKRRVKNK